MKWQVAARYRPNGSACTYWANIACVLNTIQKPQNLSLD